MTDTVSATRPWYRRWTIVVPLLSLFAWGVGFAVQHAAPTEERPLEVTAAPSAQLPPIVLPPRNRTLSGRLTGHDGSPIGDALVALIANDEPHWCYTAADGQFRLEGLERGPWTITFSASAHQPFVTTLPDDGNVATVRLPDAPRVLPTLPKHPASRLAGVLLAPTTLPLAGCEVLFRPTQPLDEIDAPLPRRALTDANGRFEIPDLRVGDYTVVALPEWAQNGSWPDLLRAQDEPARTWKQRATGNEELQLAIVAGGLRGVVADRQGGPIEGALVLVSSEADPERVWPPVTADAAGAFAVLDLPPGRYVVSVRAGSGSHRSTLVVPRGTVVDLALPPLSVERPAAK